MNAHSPLSVLAALSPAAANMIRHESEDRARDALGNLLALLGHAEFQLRPMRETARYREPGHLSTGLATAAARCRALADAIDALAGSTEPLDADAALVGHAHRRGARIAAVGGEHAR